MRYGLVGEKLSHSYSKIIHGMLGYRYELIPLSRNELDKFLRSRDFDGLNVTIPYKKTVMDYCDELDEKASMIGAVNTLYIKNGKLYGTNTDYDGFLYMIRRCGLDFSGKKILICGNGGASAMAQKASVDLGASSVFVASRKTAEASRKTGSVNFISYSEIPENIQIIVNATPVGTYPHNGERLLDISPYCDLIGAVDIIYNPFLTDLLLQARKRNIKYTNGLPMLVAQATTAAGYFTGEKYADRTAEILSSMTDRLRNVILIGMPGCGKTTIGEILSRKMDKSFYDTDEEIEKKYSRSPEKIITSDGEAAFRIIESEAAAELGKKNSAIIATGGGIILDPDNIDSLRQNGTIVYIDRDLSLLETAGRPLSGGDLNELYKKRAPLYEKHADIIVKNDMEPESSAERIIARLTDIDLF